MEEAGDSKIFGGVDIYSSPAEVSPKRIILNLDTVVMPTQIVDLCQYINVDEEKVTFNNTAFSMIRTVGVVEKATEKEDGQLVEYRIVDLNDFSSFIIALYYRGVNSSHLSYNAFAEQTVVFVTGKLGSLGNDITVIAFEIKEVDDAQELEALQMEAKLAKIFYMKEIIQKVVKNPSLFENTMLHGNFHTLKRDRKSPTAVVLKDNVNAANKKLRLKNNIVLTGQKRAIYNYLANLEKSVGATIDEIIQMIPKSTFNQLTFFADFDVLRCNGLVLSTIDGNHFVANC